MLPFHKFHFEVETLMILRWHPKADARIDELVELFTCVEKESFPFSYSSNTAILILSLFAYVNAEVRNIRSFLNAGI